MSWGLAECYMDDQINKGVVSGASISRRKDIYIGLGVRKIWREEKPGRPSCGWEDNIKMNFTGEGFEVEDWIYPSWNRNKWWAAWQRKWAFGFHKMWEISLSRWGTVSLSRRRVIYLVMYSFSFIIPKRHCSEIQIFQYSVMWRTEYRG